MELFCPECMGTLAPLDAKNIRCTAHGGQFQVLFVRRSAPPAPAPADASPAACRQHPQVAAAGNCLWCGAPVCTTCAFAQPDGRVLCPDCVAGRTGGEGDGTQAVQGKMCSVHPAVQAVHACVKCGAAVCHTCAFTFPGNVVVCPSCATAPPGLSGKRKKYAWWSLALAAFATFALVAMMLIGAAAETEEETALLGFVWIFLVFVPPLIGMGLGFSAKDRRLATPAFVWAGIVWNCVLVFVNLLLTLVGNLMG